MLTHIIVTGCVLFFMAGIGAIVGFDIGCAVERRFQEKKWGDIIANINRGRPQ